MSRKGQDSRTILPEPLGDGFYVLCDQIHRFGADALLLAWFSAPRPKERLCDLGTGCGILPLLWARDGQGLHTTAVELQPEAAELLRRAVEEQHLESKITPLCADLRHLEGILSAGEFDLVTCNPPYYPVAGGKVAARPELAIARQEVCCTLEDVVKSAARLLHPGGRFCLCHRPERLCDVFCTLRAAGLEPKRLRLVSHRRGEAPFLALVEGRRCARAALQTEDTLILEEESWVSLLGGTNL